MNVTVISATLSQRQLQVLEAFMRACHDVPPNELGPILVSLAVVCAQECKLSRETFVAAVITTFDNTHRLADTFATVEGQDA